MCAFSPMVPQKKETDVMGPVARLAGCVLLVSRFFSVVRRALAGLGIIVGWLGFGIYRLANQEGGAGTGNPFAAPTDNPDHNHPDQILSDEESETSLDLLEPALRRRYPWRHGVAEHL
jgi:hypothetical protein